MIFILMKSRSIHRIFIVPLFLFLVHSLPAQTISVRTNIDKRSILIGEQMHLNLEADFPLHEPMRFFTIDTIPHFEILGAKKIDTLDSRDGIRLLQTITLTSFDSGHWVIPSFELIGDKPMFTDSIPVDVTFSSFNPNQEYHDIKDIINVPVQKEKKQSWYLYVAVSAILVIAIIYLLTRKKKKPAVKTFAVDPYVEAKQELEKLRKENLSSKLFYTKLVDIFRIYISKRKEIASLQETSDDLILQLRALKLPEGDFDKLAQSLRTSDFVKFAKYEPAEKDKSDSFIIIKYAIDLIEKQEHKTTPAAT